MTSRYYLGYLRTSGGQLKMFQVIVGLILMMYLMGIHFDRNHDWYVLRMDVLIMLMGAFTVVFSSSFILLTILLGSTEVPFSLLYRLLYLSLTIVMLPGTAAFLKEEFNHASFRRIVMSSSTSIVFCIGILINFLLAYKPTMFETKVEVKVKKEQKEGDDKDKQPGPQ